LPTAAIKRAAVIVGSVSADDPATFEQTAQVAILHIAAIEDLPIPSGAVASFKHSPKTAFRFFLVHSLVAGTALRLFRPTWLTSTVAGLTCGS
jgi:hypothetical protein